jgi:L-aminopeptidase/D-esterase-like protein
VPVGAELSSPENPREGDEPLSKSIIIVVATDAPLLPHQLKRVARRASLGLARTGSTASNGSGDIFIAFSTANPGAASAVPTYQASMLSNRRITALFDATVQATEEAIINALIAGETMTGFNGATVTAIPHARVREILKKHGSR